MDEHFLAKVSSVQPGSNAEKKAYTVSCSRILFLVNLTTEHECGDLFIIEVMVSFQE